MLERQQQPDGLVFNIIDINRMLFRRLTIEYRMENFAYFHADDEAMKILVFQYSRYVQQDADMLLALAIKYRDNFQAKKYITRPLLDNSRPCSYR